VEGCDIPAHPRDYKENRTLGQLAMCLGNIRNLLGHKENTAHGTEMGDAPDSNHKSNKTKTKDDTAEKKKGSAVKLKENEADPVTKHERKRTGRNIKSMNKQSANKDASSPSLPENKATSMKTNPEDDATGKAANIDDVDTMDKKPTETNVDTKMQNKKQSRLSLPVGKKAKPSRVRSATTSGQPVTNTSKLNMSTTTTTVVSSMEKKNKKGESVLHAACVKGCLETVQSLLSAGASPNTQDNAGWTPLHEAASAGRLDMARVLLEAGARPSVPSKEERVTPLHDAVGSAQVEMVRLLVSRGANRDARDSKGNTPRVMAVKVGNHVMDVLENTVVEVQEEDFMETILQPHDVVLCLSTKVAANSKLVKALTEAATKLGCRKPSSQLRDDMTHLLVEGEEEDQSLNALTAHVLGAEIVTVTWLLESMKQGRVVSCVQYRCEGKGVEGARKGRLRRASNQPGLFAGLHFFLTGTFEPPCFTKAEVQNMVKMAGGKVITREPDPEFIPSQEDTVPHHALISSSIASTSHVILYMAGGKREPMIKYNMKHVKTLPVSWLLSCITSGCVTDPAGL